jgi:hypothetical protein
MSDEIQRRRDYRSASARDAGKIPFNPHMPTEGAEIFSGGDMECDWLLNAFRCQMGQVYDAADLKACWRALGQEPGEMSDGDLSRAIIKSFLKFSNG